MTKILKNIYTYIIFIGDIVIIYFSLVTAYFIRFNCKTFINIIPVTKGVPPWKIYEQLFYLILPLWITSFIVTKLYKKNISVFDELINTIKGTTLAIIFTMAATFVYREEEYSRLTIGIMWLISSLLIFIWHECIKYIYQISVVRVKNVLIIGGANDIDKIKNSIRKHRDLRPFFLVDVREKNDILNYVTKKNIDEVYVISSFFNTKEIVELADRCQEKNIEFKVIPDLLQLRFGEISIDESLAFPVFHIKSLSLTGVNYLYKRIFDITLSIILLSLLLPFLMTVAVLIKFDSHGPVFYVHKRKGYRGRIFNCYKFRTMVENADKLLEKIKHLSERSGPVFKMRDDPRLTRVGKFLRRYSIDEIPQLFNVLRGEMSLVGPRPQVLWETEAYDATAKRRLNVMSGITGLWQVSGRANLSYEQMIELDIYYIENWSLGLDLMILLKTIHAIFSQRGAF